MRPPERQRAKELIRAHLEHQGQGGWAPLMAQVPQVSDRTFYRWVREVRGELAGRRRIELARERAEAAAQAYTASETSFREDDAHAELRDIAARLEADRIGSGSMGGCSALPPGTPNALLQSMIIHLAEITIRPSGT